MTCKEKLKLDHPEWDDRRVADEVAKFCPRTHGYMDKPDWCSPETVVCIECWNREMPVDDKVEFVQESFFDMVREAYNYAMREGIKVNSIVINKNFVKVPSTWIRNGCGGAIMLPPMICGLNAYLTEDELPEGYSFALLNGPENRLAKFESIGMEPEELRKAAERYRRIKEVME